MEKNIINFLENKFSNDQVISGAEALRVVIQKFKISEAIAEPIIRRWVMEKAGF